MIYDRVKKLCTEKNISIFECEKRAGLGNGVISGWKESSPRIDTLKAVAKVLDVPLDELAKDDT